MAFLIDSLVPSTTYNKLPHVGDVRDAPVDHAQDLKDLGELLIKHQVPKNVVIRLIHKHFDTKDGEVMVFETIDIPGHGKVKTMQPVATADNKALLRGINFFVNDEGRPQAYEYGRYDLPELDIESFLDDFCSMVVQRGVQHKFGLSIRSDDQIERVAWTEFEFPLRRSTIMLQASMPKPEANGAWSVNTEWDGIVRVPTDCSHVKTCRHGSTTCNHEKKCRGHEGHHADGCEEVGQDDYVENGFRLGGETILPGHPAFELVSAIAVHAF